MYQQVSGGFGGGMGAGVLTLDRALPLTLPSFGRADAKRPERLFDYTPDLGVDIGSRTWWRGVVTCTALCAATWMLAPGFHPLLVAPAPKMPADAWEQARAQSIAPLAWGADTGRKMGATDAVQTLSGTPERPVLELTASLGQGDGLGHALQRAGVGKGDAARIVAMTSDVVDPGEIAPGTTLAITLGRRATQTVPRPLEALAFRARFDTRVVFKRAAGAFVMQRQPIAVDSTPLRVSGPVGDGIYVSATAAGAPPQAVQDYIRALAPKVEFGALDGSSRYDLIVERDRAATGEVRFGKLLYVGLSQGERATRMIQWTIDGRKEWFDPAGVGQQRPGFATPVAGARKTSGFGWRIHPLLGYSRLHQGTDYGAPYGTPIRAATDGVVSFAGWHGGHGKMVKLQHAGGLGSGYAHMSRIAVEPGARVVQGQVIGYVGSTGLSTGPHLHFEVYRSGVAVNPSGVTFAATSLLSGAELQAFRDRFRRIASVGSDGQGR